MVSERDHKVYHGIAQFRRDDADWWWNLSLWEIRLSFHGRQIYEESIEMILSSLEDGSKVFVVTMAIPAGVFKFLSEASVKYGKPVGVLVSEALQEKIEKIAAEMRPEESGG